MIADITQETGGGDTREADKQRAAIQCARRSARAHKSPPVQLTFFDRARKVCVVAARSERGASDGDCRDDLTLAGSRRACLEGSSWWAQASASARAVFNFDRAVCHSGEQSKPRSSSIESGRLVTAVESGVLAVFGFIAVSAPFVLWALFAIWRLAL